MEAGHEEGIIQCYMSQDPKYIIQGNMCSNTPMHEVIMSAPVCKLEICCCGYKTAIKLSKIMTYIYDVCCRSCIDDNTCGWYTWIIGVASSYLED